MVSEKKKQTQQQQQQQPPQPPKGYMLVPPDGGWGWVVLGGIIMIGQIIVVPTLCFGIFLKDILISMDTTTATASWIPSINVAMCLFFAPISAMVCQIYSCRTAGMLGGLIASSGVFFSYFATRVEVLYLTYGVLVGCGNGLTLNANFLVLSHYFRNYYGIVTGIALGSYAAGRLIMTPIIQLALENYGFRGTFLIMSALQLHICVGSSLFQPAAKYQKLVPIDSNENDSKNTCKNENGNDNCKNENELNDKEIVKRNAENRCSKNYGKDEEISQLLTNTQLVANNQKNEACCNKLTDKQQQLPNKKLLTVEEEPKRVRSWSKGQEYDKSLLHLSSPLDVFGSMETIRSRTVSMSENNPLPAPTPLTQKPTKKKSNCCLRLFQSGPFATLDFTIFKEAIFYVVCIGGTANYITSVYSNIFLPPLALENNLTPMEAATVLSIRAGAEIIGRIGSPLLQQRLNIPLRYFFIGITFITIVTLLVLPMMTTFATMSAVIIVNGLSFGAQTGLNLVMMVHSMGSDRLLSVLGLSQFIQGFATLTIGPLLGLAKDKFGSFKYVFFFIGLVQIIHAFSWSLKPLIIKKEKSQQDITSCA